MTGVVAPLAALITIGMAWRGYRRGAAATLVGWLPMIAAMAAFSLVAWCGTLWPERLVLLCAVGLAVAVGVFTAGRLTLRARRRGPAADGPSDKETAEEEDKRVQIRRARMRRADRLAGAGLGVLYGAVLCLTLAGLGSMVSLAFSLPKRGRDAAQAAQRRPLAFGRACGRLADLATDGLLTHIPLVGEVSRSFRALIVILNAPPEHLRYVAVKRGFPRLLKIPEVKDALADRHYLDLIRRTGRGNLFAFVRLGEHPLTRRLLASEELREFTEDLSLAELAKDIREAEKKLSEGEPDRPVSAPLNPPPPDETPPRRP